MQRLTATGTIHQSAATQADGRIISRNLQTHRYQGGVVSACQICVHILPLVLNSRKILLTVARPRLGFPAAPADITRHTDINDLRQPAVERVVRHRPNQKTARRNEEASAPPDRGRIKYKCRDSQTQDLHCRDPQCRCGKILHSVRIEWTKCGVILLRLRTVKTTLSRPGTAVFRLESPAYSPRCRRVGTRDGLIIFWIVPGFS